MGPKALAGGHAVRGEAHAASNSPPMAAIAAFAAIAANGARNGSATRKSMTAHLSGKIDR